jgi:DNA-binding response OmpR family regulator
MRLLVIEDNADLRDTLDMGLTAMGHEVDLAADGGQGLRMALSGAYDAWIVDWMLPAGPQGPEVVAQLRGAGVFTPALMLTARTASADLVQALGDGADDYLAKPFAFDVLEARLEALVRRSTRSFSDEDAPVRVGPLEVSPSGTARLGGAPLELRAKEAHVLRALALNLGHVVSRTRIAESVWDDPAVSDDVLNTTVASLRRKLRASARTLVIETLRGVGYRLRVTDEPAESS